MHISRRDNQNLYIECPIYNVVAQIIMALGNSIPMHKY